VQAKLAQAWNQWQMLLILEKSISPFHFDFLDSTFLFLALPVTQTKRQRAIFGVD
jgi:hypothetical protein